MPETLTSIEDSSHENNRESNDSISSTEKRQESQESTQCKQILDTYRQAEKNAAGQSISNDIEYATPKVDTSQGYIPYLEALLKEVKDEDEWLGDSGDEQGKERLILTNAAAAVRENLGLLQRELDTNPDHESSAYKQMNALFVDRSARLTELLAGVDENFENAELRNADIAGQQAMETIARMTADQAIEWVSRMMSNIDGNNWQSNGLKETYGKLAIACRQGLQKKLAEEKTASLQDPKIAESYVQHCMEVAKLFTDRGTPVDSALTDIDFAAEMAKEAMGFDELALRYIETSFNQESPLKAYINGHRDDALSRLEALPEETKSNPQVEAMRSKLVESQTSIQGLTEQYAILRNLETMFAGGGEINLEQEINEKLSGWLERSMGEFEKFLDGTIGGAASLDDINAAIGVPPLTVSQIEAWKLVADIQGYGYDLSDKTWSYVGAGAKIAAMIAAGIAVGVATGGLGIVGAALAGGVAMTATNAVMNQQGFDDMGDALNTYGKDFAINATTMGAARYLAAGRAAYQLSRSGVLQEAGGLPVLLKIASQKGGAKLIGSLDDASSVGTRLVGATLEGSADTLIGSSLDTIVQGGNFLDNLQQNAMFMGLGYAEFSGSTLRSLRGLPAEELHGVAQMVNTATVHRTKLGSLCSGTKLDPKALMDSSDLPSLLTGVDAGTAAAISETVQELRDAKQQFEAMFQKAVADNAADVQGTGKAEAVEDAYDADVVQAAKSTPEGRAALLNHMQKTGVSDVTRLKMAEDLIGPLTQVQKDSIILAHNTGTGNLVDGYTKDDLQAKYNIMAEAGLTKQQIGLLMDTGVAGNAFFDALASMGESARHTLFGDTWEQVMKKIRLKSGTVISISQSKDPSLLGKWTYIKDEGDTIFLCDPNSTKTRRISKESMKTMMTSVVARPSYVPLSLDGQLRNDWFVKGVKNDGVFILGDGELTVFATRRPDGVFVEQKQSMQSTKPPVVPMPWNLNRVWNNFLPPQKNATKNVHIPKRQPFQVGQEVYCLSSSGAPERGWIVQREDSGNGFKLVSRETYLVNGKWVPLRRNFLPDQVAHIHEIEDVGTAVGNMPLHKSLEAMRRKFDLLDKQTEGMMTKEQFAIYFGDTLKQGINTGNCYLIAAFASLQRSPHFEAIIRTSIKRTKPPSAPGVLVGFPLGSSRKKEWIPVFYDDVKKQQVDPTTDKRNRTSLYAVEGRIGWKMLEAAYIKMVTKNNAAVDRRATEGGFGHEALMRMFGDSVMNNELGTFNELSLSSGNRQEVQKLHKWLDGYSPSKDIATVNSKYRKTKKNEHPNDKSYKVKANNGDVEIFYNHAYSIRSVDKFNKRVAVSNPHDTHRPIFFESYGDFADAFSHISGVEIDMNNIFL